LSRNAARIDACSCKIVAAIRRERRCSGEHLHDKEIVSHRRADKAR
jgi:hypothetical protein